MLFKNFCQTNGIKSYDRLTSSSKSYKKSKATKKQWLEFPVSVSGCCKALMSLAAAKASDEALLAFDISMLTLEDGEEIWAIKKASSATRKTVKVAL